MNRLTLANKVADWHRLKSLVLDSVSSPITKRVYNLGLDEFFEWCGQEPRPGFTKATVAAWRVALEGPGAGPPNAHELVKRFPLFDNFYDPSRQSADGHQWIAEGPVCL